MLLRPPSQPWWQKGRRIRNAAAHRTPPPPRPLPIPDPTARIRITNELASRRRLGDGSSPTCCPAEGEISHAWLVGCRTAAWGVWLAGRCVDGDDPRSGGKTG